jgi:hypothetical protein
MTVSDDKAFDALMGHYNDTFKYIQEYSATREKLFLITLLIVLFMSVDVTSSADAVTIAKDFLEKKLELKLAIKPAFISSMLWFSLLSVLIRYFQMVILINRQYDYIHNVEENLCSLLGRDYIFREGKAYVKSYPIFSEWTQVIYTILFPIFLMLVVCIKIYKEFAIRNTLGIGYYIDIVIFTMIIVSVVLYWVQLHHKK